MRNVEVKVLMDYVGDGFELKKDEVIEIEFHISGNPTYGIYEIEVWDDDEFDKYFGEVD